MATEQRSASRAVQVVALVAVVLILVLCGLVAAAPSSSIGCKGCHFRNVEFKAGTLSTKHATVPCAQCHVQSNRPLAAAKFGFYEVFGMGLRVVNPTHADISAPKDDQCLSCHSVVMTQVTTSGGFRIKHERCTDGRACIDCHGEVGHGAATTWARVYSMNDCVACHKALGAPMACAACHVGDVEKKSFTGPEFTVTHGPNWKQTHGMGQMSSCSACHKPTSCARCHGPGVPHTASILTEHPALAKQKDAKCSTCHTEAFCFSCHQTQMPHPPAFASEHSKIVKAKGPQNCLRCHAQSDCDNCHIRHVHPGGSVGNIPKPGKVAP